MISICHTIQMPSRADQGPIPDWNPLRLEERLPFTNIVYILYAQYNTLCSYVKRKSKNIFGNTITVDSGA